MVFLLFCFLCGLSIWGAYCVPLAPLFRGFGMGITAGYLYAAYGFQGFLFHLAVILPGAFICLIAILIASRESMLFSKKIHLGRKTEEQEAQPKNNVRHFFIRFSILTGILIILPNNNNHSTYLTHPPNHPLTSNLNGHVYLI